MVGSGIRRDSVSWASAFGLRLRSGVGAEGDGCLGMRADWSWAHHKHQKYVNGGKGSNSGEGKQGPAC